MRYIKFRGKTLSTPAADDKVSFSDLTSVVRAAIVAEFPNVVGIWWALHFDPRKDFPKFYSEYITVDFPDGTQKIWEAEWDLR